MTTPRRHDISEAHGRSPWTMLATYLAALFLLGSGICLAASQSPQPAGDHSWLVGVWEGSLNIPVESKPGRTLRVLSVALDGSAQGTWFTTGEEEYLASIKVTGSR